MSFKIFSEIFNKNWDILITGIIIGVVLYVMQSKRFKDFSVLMRAFLAFLIGLVLIFFYSLCQYLDKVYFF
ncbi:hypothetical protein ACFL0X_02380 [Nanoarchaeota archaeon]